MNGDPLFDISASCQHPSISHLSLQILKNITCESWCEQEQVDCALFKSWVHSHLIKWGMAVVASQWQGLIQQASWGEGVLSESYGDWLNSLSTQMRQQYNAILQAQSHDPIPPQEIPVIWGGISATVQNRSPIWQMLAWIGSPMVLCGALSPIGEVLLILGLGSHAIRDGFHWIDCHEELIRTPHLIDVLPALMVDNTILIRHQAISSLYNKKWGRGDNGVNNTLTWCQQMGSGLRQLALTHARLLPQPILKQRLITDMTSLISSHEWGHAVMQHHILPSPIGSFSDAMQAMGCPALFAGLEWLAELAPKTNGRGGTLADLCDRSNREHANRQFWMFWSDVWFFDTPMRHLDDYSEVLSLIMFMAIHSDGSLHLDTWAHWIWSPENGFYNYIRDWLIRWSNQWMRQVLTQSHELKNWVESMGEADYATQCQVWGKGLSKLDLRDIKKSNERALADMKGVIYQNIQKKWPSIRNIQDVVACIQDVTNQWELGRVLNP